MSTVFCLPKPITYETASTLTSAHPKNLTMDEPNMVWRSSGLSGVYVVFKLDGTPIDTIALIGNNLRASDTFRVRMGATVASLNGVPAFDQTYTAWTGLAPIAEATSVVQLETAVTHQYIRIDFTSTGNPDGFVEVSRLLVGKRVTNVGIDIGHEQTFDDRSIIEEGPGSTTIDRYNVRQNHRITVKNVDDEDWYTNWEPFLAAAGQSKFFLYREADDGPYVQRKTFYVRNVAAPKRSNLGWNNQAMELTVVTYR